VAAETRYCTVSVSSGPQHIVDFGRTRQHSETLGSRCGDESRPWTVDALNGQRIVVSLIDFTTTTTTGMDSLLTDMGKFTCSDVVRCYYCPTHTVVCGRGRLGLGQCILLKFDTYR